MTIKLDSLQDWSAVELKAQTHELKQVETYKVPIAYTQEQQLAFATVRCAELQARLQRMQTKAGEAHMWLSMGETTRAQQAVNSIILDL